MSVEYQVFKVDPEPYRQWMVSYPIEELEDDQYDQAMVQKEECAVSVTDRLYPPELHNLVAQVADEILRALKKGAVVRIEKPSPSLFGRLLGRKEVISEKKPIVDRQLTGFMDFGRVVYWSQVGGSKPNELEIQSDTVEVTLGSSGLATLVGAL